MKSRPNCIIIMDGYGISDTVKGNAIKAAGSEYINNLMKEYPSTVIGASGLDVGLPEGQMGNSEVGHLNIGAGRIIYQDLTKITKSIKDGDFFTNPALLKAIENAKSNGKKLHLYGLLSTGGVHSHITHLFALLDLAKKSGVKDTFVHCFLDGRDTLPTSGIGFVKELDSYIKQCLRYRHRSPHAFGFGQWARQTLYFAGRQRCWSKNVGGFAFESRRFTKWQKYPFTDCFACGYSATVR